MFLALLCSVIALFIMLLGAAVFVIFYDDDW